MSMDLASNNSSEDDDADDANAMSFEASNRRSKINVEKELVIAAKLFIPIRPLILLCRAAAVVLCGIIVIVRSRSSRSKRVNWCSRQHKFTCKLSYRQSNRKCYHEPCIIATIFDISNRNLIIDVIAAVLHRCPAA